MFPARPTSSKTPLIGTWLPVGATDSAEGGREGTSCASTAATAAGGDSGGGDGEEDGGGG